MIFAPSRSVPYMAYIIHVVTGVCGAVRWAYAMLVCVLFVSSRSDIVFNLRACFITDQSAKEIYQYFKSRTRGGPRPPKAGILPSFSDFTEWVK